MFCVEQCPFLLLALSLSLNLYPQDSTIPKIKLECSDLGWLQYCTTWLCFLEHVLIVINLVQVSHPGPGFCWFSARTRIKVWLSWTNVLWFSVIMIFIILSLVPQLFRKTACSFPGSRQIFNYFSYYMSCVLFLQDQLNDKSQASVLVQIQAFLCLGLQ